MVGTGANRTPLTKIHPILLGKQKSEGTSLLAHHRQQHEERLQQMAGHNVNLQVGRGPRPPQQPPLPPQPGYGQQPPQPSHAPPPSGYPSSMYGQNQQGPFPPNSQPPQAPPPPGFGSLHQMSSGNLPNSYGRTRHADNSNSSVGSDSGDGETIKKKRRSRWGAADDKAMITGPMTLPADLTEEQRKQYLLQFKIEEITQKLRTGELGIPPDPADRSPSPEPIYNSEGKRLNTREFRVRKALEEERHVLIKQAVDEVSNYKPPIDYKPPASKICDKVFIPAERNPAVNFIGLLIGPRGNTLKRLEKETGCKIIIRGKGSVKEGKVGRIPGQLMPGEDEPLHALITGPTEAEVKKGVRVVSDIVKEGIECPDAANELRRNQLRELAELNGTLIDEEVIKCKNCGATDHRHWECTERKNITSEISCNKCGGYGHVAADCKVKLDANTAPTQTFTEKAKMDTEYMSLMAELGVDAPPPPPPPKRVFQETPPSAPVSSSVPPVSVHPPASMASPSHSFAPSSNMPSSVAMSRMPPPDINMAPPRNSLQPSLLEPPKHAVPHGHPISSNIPQSLMDLNVLPNNTNTPMPNQRNQFDGPRPNLPNSGAPPPWRNRGPTPLMQAQRNPLPGNSATPPWQQQGNFRGPPPSASPQNSQMDPYRNIGNSSHQGSQQSVGYPNQWSRPPGFNQLMPQNSFENLPPWAQQPPPPPPPPPST